MKCRKCKEKMKQLPQSFDAFSFMNPYTQMFCENKECEHYGLVTVVAIPDEDKKEV